MKLRFTARADKDFVRMPVNIRNSLKKQLQFLLTDLSHPSLHAKKFDRSRDIWQARVSRDWRFYFTIEGDEYTILSIIPHPK